MYNLSKQISNHSNLFDVFNGKLWKVLEGWI